MNDTHDALEDAIAAGTRWAWHRRHDALEDAIAERQVAAAHELQEYPAHLWLAETTNRKTGNIPTLYLGSTREESKATCAGCPLLDNGCYSQGGTVAMGHSSTIKKLDRVGMGAYSIENALRNSWRGAKYARATAIGDAARAAPEKIRADHDAVRAFGLGWLAYTHFPWEALANGVADLFVASVSSLADADAVLAAGYTRAAVVLPWDAYQHGRTFTTPAGEKGVICPALWAHSKDKRLTCNDCGLCDPVARGPKVVGFPDHGPGVKGRIRTAAKAGITWALNLARKL